MVVCVKYTEDDGPLYLTLGKMYEVLEIDSSDNDEYYRIIDDNNTICYYSTYFFEEISD